MKTGTQKKPGKDIRTLNETRKIDKKSIIVLVIAALLFFGAFFWLHSEDIIKDTNDIFSPYSEDEIVEFEKATVNEIVKVPFSRPRNRSELIKTEEYGRFRNKLLSLLYNDIAERIGGDEVVL